MSMISSRKELQFYLIADRMYVIENYVDIIES